MEKAWDKRGSKVRRATAIRPGTCLGQLFGQLSGQVNRQTSTRHIICCRSSVLAARECAGAGWDGCKWPRTDGQCSRMAVSVMYLQLLLFLFLFASLFLFSGLGFISDLVIRGARA